MTSVQSSEVPNNALLRRYHEHGGYADCYVTEVNGVISQATFVETFYTTTLFKLERTILKWALGKPSTDLEAKQLAEGILDTFAVWRVEARSDDQLLMGDFTGRTKSWLMAIPVAGGSVSPRTRLYFGSAVVPRVDSRTGTKSMGLVFNVLLGFHRLYSRLLLGAARARLLVGQKES